MVRVAILVLSFSAIALCSLAQNPKELPAKVAIERLEKDIPGLLKEADIPGHIHRIGSEWTNSLERCLWLNECSNEEAGNQ